VIPPPLPPSSYDRKRHYALKDAMLVATGLNRFLARVQGLETKRPLFVTHCSRSDVILGFAAHTHKLELVDQTFEGALILSGLETHPMSSYVLDMIKVRREEEEEEEGGRSGGWWWLIRQQRQC